MSFTDRFEIRESLREGDVQTFRGRERATGRDVEVHLSASSEALPPAPAIDRGTYDGKFYVVTTPAAQQATALDSAGAWKIKTPPSPPPPTLEPGEFTRMFHLKQAPEPVASPASNPKKPAIPLSQPGNFTRAIQKPSAAASAQPGLEPGQAGEFTRMFHTPAAPPGVPEAPAPASKPRESASPVRFSTALKVGLTLVLFAIAVFVLMRAF